MSEEILKIYEEWLDTGEHPELASFKKKVDEIKRRMAAGDRMAGTIHTIRQIEALRADLAKDEADEKPDRVGPDRGEQRKNQLQEVHDWLEKKKA